MADTFAWEGAFSPVKVFGNLYFVGTVPASTHILDTGDGLIMFDSGYQHSLYLVIHNMHLMGLDPRNLKYIIHTHGHIDHFGATRALVELSGAKTVIGRADKEYADGSLDLSYAKELGMEFKETFVPDILLDDGDEILLGNARIKAVATPGHTPRCHVLFLRCYRRMRDLSCRTSRGVGYQYDVQGISRQIRTSVFVKRGF